MVCLKIPVQEISCSGGFLLFLHSLYNSLKSFYNKRLKCIYHFTADLNAVPSDWHFRLCCQGLRGKYRLRTYLIDRTHSNSYSTWAMLRCPEHPTIRERGMIHQAGKVLPLFGEELIDTNNEWSQEMILGHNSICLFELFPQSEHVECKEI